MKFSYTSLILLSVVLISCQEDKPKSSAADTVTQETPDAPEMEFQNKAHELVYQMTQAAGDYQKLRALKDVAYVYTYTTPDQKTDQTEEKYIFDGELSYGKYIQHERTLADLEGTIEQGYDGKNFWLRNDGKYLEDEKAMKRVVFNRKTNFYWFTMLQKLMDPGLNYEYVMEDQVGGISYDVVKITFDSEDGKPTDIYQLWINKQSKFVDQFLFTVMDFNKADPFLLKMEYEEVNGIQIPSKRLYTKADWDGNNLDENWIKVTWTDISFDNGLSRDLFKKTDRAD